MEPGEQLPEFVPLKLPIVIRVESLEPAINLRCNAKLPPFSRLRSAANFLAIGWPFANAARPTLCLFMRGEGSSADRSLLGNGGWASIWAQAGVRCFMRRRQAWRPDHVCSVRSRIHTIVAKWIHVQVL